MNKFIIRNDDVAVDTDLRHLKKFCHICDKYGFKMIQAITPRGEVRKITTPRLTNDRIVKLSNKKISENIELIEYLKERGDLVGVHGLWHTHKPTIHEIAAGKSDLEHLGLYPTYFVPPFNEGVYADQVLFLKTCQLSADDGQRLEDFLIEGEPKSEIMYLHSWRFEGKPYGLNDLERCLHRLSKIYPTNEIKLNLGCKWRRLPGFDNRDKIYGWLFQDGLPMYEDGSVDGITISHALLFLTNAELNDFIKEARRVLKTGGVIRITEDDSENPKSAWYKTGNLSSGPKCLTGPVMMREILELNGFLVFDVNHNTTHFQDRTLVQAYRGGAPNVFFIEGIR